MNIFLDVGGHKGETSEAALKFNFDAVHCFEPSAETRKFIKINDERFHLHEFGMYSSDKVVELHHGRHSYSASIYADKRHVDQIYPTETIKLHKASDWIVKNFSEGDMLMGKINVEGAEVDILEDLESAGTLSLFRVLVVYPDHRKVPSIKARGRAVFERVLGQHKNVVMSTDAFDMTIGTIEARTEKWLSGRPEVRPI